MATRLPIEEDLDFERAEGRFARALWYALLAVMTATLLGLFGNGPLSAARAGDPGGAFWVEFDRFGRLGAAMRTTVHVQGPSDGAISFTVDRSYFDGIRILAVTPEPDEALIVSDGIRYTFRSLAAPGIVTIDFEPRRMGRVGGRAAGAGVETRLQHFIYP